MEKSKFVFFVKMTKGSETLNGLLTGDGLGHNTKNHLYSYLFEGFKEKINESSPFLAIKEEMITPAQNTTEFGDDWDILLIWDQVKYEDCKTIFKENVWILYHNMPEWISKELESTINRKYLKKGHHTTDPKQGYVYLRKLLEAYPQKEAFSKNKYEEFIQIMEAYFEVKSIIPEKLALLHEIYDGDKNIGDIKVPDVLLAKYGANLLSDLKTIINGHAKYDNSNSTHRQALIKLRDALLADEE